MLNFLKGFITPAAAISPPLDSRAAFRQALLSYPAHVPPHRGFAKALSLEQADLNLQWFTDSLHSRISALQSFLLTQGIDLHDVDATSLSSKQAALTQIIAWVRDCWPQEILRPEHKQYDYWLDCDRQGDDAIYSLALDLGTLFGQWAIASRPEWHWGLDLTGASLQDPMLQARRVVLTTLPLGPQSVPYQIDMEAVSVTRYMAPSLGQYLGELDQDDWMLFMHDCHTGRVIDLMQVR